MTTDENMVAQIEALGEKLADAKASITKRFIGQERVVDLTLTALLCGGHGLLIGLPGLGKTRLVETLSTVMGLDGSRVQFTPDLMPADILGSEVLDTDADGTRAFRFLEGPIFCQLLMADEINRASPRTQSALLQAMQEKTVTVAGQDRALGTPFHVLATQNPIEQEGTYKLPEAQLDRFLFKITLDYPSLAEERAILGRFRNDFTLSQKENVKAVITPAEIKACQTLIEQVQIKDELLDYIAAIIHNTRNNKDLFLGASPRASLAIMKASKAYAAMNNRDFVTPDDIRYVALPVLNHRIILSSEREIDGYNTKDVVTDILKKIEVPR